MAIDIKVSGRGDTLLRFKIQTEQARAWVDEFVELEGYQWVSAGVFVVEHQYADPLIEAMREKASW